MGPAWGQPAREHAHSLACSPRLTHFRDGACLCGFLEGRWRVDFLRRRHSPNNSVCVWFFFFKICLSRIIYWCISEGFAINEWTECQCTIREIQPCQIMNLTLFVSRAVTPKKGYSANVVRVSTAHMTFRACLHLILADSLRGLHTSGQPRYLPQDPVLLHLSILYNISYRLGNMQYPTKSKCC